MKGKVQFFATCFVLALGLLGAGASFAYYYPPTGHVPPGPPPNYNQVDSSYFLGTPTLPLPVPDDSGGLYVYYDQGIWTVANHLYSRERSLEQFHCCILALMSQPPELGVNVFIEGFEFWGDTIDNYCLEQNDRWGWIPWGDNLYEIWWDVTTKEWIDAEGDPDDFMRFSIAGCAVDFNLWSSGHGCFFGDAQIYLGASMTRLYTVPGFWDTFPAWDDPYQSQAGSNPTADPNITIFTLKSDTPRSYNKLGLINSTDSYGCDLALQYGQRYAGSFAYEGNGVQFSTSNLCPSNRRPSILITPDTSIFQCTADSVMIWISASDPDVDDTITVEKILGAGTYQPQRDLTPIFDQFRFLPDTCGVYRFIFRVTDDHGGIDQDTSLITVTFNRPPQLTCPEDGVVLGGETFISTDFSVSDPDGHPAPVTFLDINPPSTNQPTIVDRHVEWITTSGEGGDYSIRLLATDSCGLADTCDFMVAVGPVTGDLYCPDDDSVHAGELFVSTNFALTYPECDPSSVEVLDISPAATHDPTIVGYHVEWVTTCAEDGDYVIRLMTGESCSVQDTCSFTVTVYNRPPELTCPDYGRVQPLDLFISTDFYTSDPDGDDVLVYLLGIDPPAEYDPVIVERHVEWQTTCLEGDYVITLMAIDPCGLADTCDFTVTVSSDPVPDFYIWAYPITQYVAAGRAVGYLVELNSVKGFVWPCTLMVTGFPDPPISGIFDQTRMTPTDFTLLNIYTTPGTDTGTYTLTITGKEISGPCTHSTQVHLRVLAPLYAGEETDDQNTPTNFTLFQNQPNPFNPETQISYYLPQDCQVRLTIYNLLGRRVKTLFDGHQDGGMHTLIWDGRADGGSRLSSGIYFYRLEADNFLQTKKMTLMK